MLHHVFNWRIFSALDNAYPNKYKPWELRKVSHGFWTKEKSREAIKWMVEDKLECNIFNFRKKIRESIFRENGLGAMIDIIYHSSFIEALTDVYPEIKWKSIVYNRKQK